MLKILFFIFILYLHKNLYYIYIINMNIHPIWTICISVRLLIAYIIRYINTKTGNYNKFISIILTIIGLGFIYQGYFSSNNEIQIAKVFWHDSRYIHGILYILAAIYLINNNINMNTTLLLLDLSFSFLYRIINNK